MKHELLISPKLAAKLVELQQRHETRRVFWRWTHNTFHSVTFMSFFNKSGVKGLGKECLKEFLDLTDRYLVGVDLWTDVPTLVPYYQSLGFVNTSTICDTVDGWMPTVYFHRNPQSQFATDMIAVADLLLDRHIG